jgi:hypothetical protein
LELILIFYLECSNARDNKTLFEITTTIKTIRFWLFSLRICLVISVMDVCSAMETVPRNCLNAAHLPTLEGAPRVNDGCTPQLETFQYCSDFSDDDDIEEWDISATDDGGHCREAQRLSAVSSDISIQQARCDETALKPASCSDDAPNACAADVLGPNTLEKISGTSGCNSNLSAANDYETVFTNSKAGMDGVDKEYVKRVVFEMSRASDFFKNEQRKDAAHRSSNEQLAARVAALTRAELAAAEAVADRFMERAEAARDLGRRFIHVDMDMFFAAVEQLRRPELAEVPMAVGGLGMISTANYVARKYGVRSAMPGFIGKVRPPARLGALRTVARRIQACVASRAADMSRRAFRRAACADAVGGGVDGDRAGGAMPEAGDGWHCCWHEDRRASIQ